MNRKSVEFEPISIFVGRKIKERREYVGLAQHELGSKIGVSFQQVQKYEYGKNRVSLNILYLIAKELKVNISYFIEGFEAKEKLDFSNEFLEAREFAKFFNKITDEKIRKKVVNLVKAVAKE